MGCWCLRQHLKHCAKCWPQLSFFEKQLHGLCWNLLLFIVTKGRKKGGRVGGREWERDQDVPFVGSFCKWLQQLGLSQGEARILKLHPSLQRGWWELKYLSQHPLPPRVCISRNLELEVKLGVGVKEQSREGSCFEFSFLLQTIHCLLGSNDSCKFPEEIRFWKLKSCLVTLLTQKG